MNIPHTPLSLILLLLACWTSSTLEGQTASGSVMVIPDPAFVMQRGFKITPDGADPVPDYPRLLREDVDVPLVINRLEGLFEENKYELISFSQTVRSEAGYEIEKMAQRIDGQKVASSVLNQVLSIAKPDVAIMFRWVNYNRTQGSLTLVVEILDGYTGDIVATHQADVEGAFNDDLSNIITKGIEQVRGMVFTKVDKQLLRAEQDGRRVLFKFNIKQGDGEFFEFLPDDRTLGEFVTDWLFDNAVKGAVNPKIETGSQLEILVNIPRRDANGAPVILSRWLRPLRTALREVGYSYQYNTSQNLGNAEINLKKLEP